MHKITKPKPIDNEIILDPTKVIMSKTDKKGIIKYANNYFVKISGYTEEELIGKPHNIIRHPDMPKIVFKLMWERLHKGENIYAVVKNLTKDGSYYWVITTFETSYDKDGNILAHYARRKAVPQKIKDTTQALYKSIVDIEKHSVKLAEKYFYEALEKQGLTYDTLLQEIAEMNEQDIYNYFQSIELNTNTSNENIIAEIDTNILKQNNSNIDNILSQLIKNINPEKKGFLGNIFDDLKKELGSDLQIKNPLK